jgi:hypothetical protein
MTNIIGAIIFIILSVLLITSSANLIRHTQRNVILSTSITVEAKELAEFSYAAYSYSESLGESLTPVSLTVSSLQSAGLLSNTFPQKTPFGQSFIANYTQDSCNPAVMDLVIKTTGSYNSDLLAKNGINGTLGLNYINSEVDNKLNQLNLSYSNASNPCVTNGNPYYIGYTLPSSSALNIYSSGTISTNIKSLNNDAEIYIYAPNQYGYLIVDGNISGSGEYGSVTPTNINSNVISSWNFSSQGWSQTCPYGGNILNTGSNFYNFNYGILQIGTTTLSEDLIFCIPIYKSQNFTFNRGSNLQILNNYSYFYYLDNYAGSFPNIYYAGPGSVLVENDMTYVSPSSINGLNMNIFGTTGYYLNHTQNNSDYVSDNYISNKSLANIIAANGFSLNFNGNIYQFAAWDYYFFTGKGCPTPITTNAEGQSYPSGATIWSDGYTENTSSGICPSNSYNLNTSVQNYGIGYSVTVNPSNSSSVTGTIKYVPNNNSSSESETFSIPTPQIN